MNEHPTHTHTHVQGEFWYNNQTGKLLYFRNESSSSEGGSEGGDTEDEYVASQLGTLVRVRGSASEPVVGVRFSGIRFANTASSSLQPHSTKLNHVVLVVDPCYRHRLACCQRPVDVSVKM